MRSPKVSVIIPTFNHRAVILETLESAFAQRLPDSEIIVVNDGSPDDTKTLLEPLVRAGRIEYIEQPNQGVATARNTGIARARGEYIALLDDDDLWPPDKLQWQVAYLDANPDVGVVAGTLQTIDDHASLGQRAGVYPQITFESLFRGNPFYSPGQTLIRAGLLRDIGGLDTSIWGADDWDLWFRIAKKTRIVMVDRLALFYRLHAGNNSKQTARLIAACCVVIDRHLPDLPVRRHAAVRCEAHFSLYSTFGSLLTREARARFKNRDFLGAARSLWGLRPLAYSLLRDSSARRAVASDVRSLLANS